MAKSEGSRSRAATVRSSRQPRPMRNPRLAPPDESVDPDEHSVETDEHVDDADPVEPVGGDEDGPEVAAPAERPARSQRRVRVTEAEPDPTAIDLAFTEPSRELVAREQREDPDDLEERRLSDVNEWGRSEHLRELARRLYDPVYRHWFRAEWEDLDKIPSAGGALLVANHAGAVPSDAPVIMHGIETELERPVYGLADNLFRTLPMIGTLWNRLGGLPAHPDNAYRLLHDQDQLVLVFPEGVKGPAKTYGERYRLRRFGRGGFVEIAMRSGVPVVPIAVVGAEESMPTLFRLPNAAKVLGLPYVPVTANMVLGGPLGAMVYLPAKFKLRVLDPVYFDVPPDQERYSRSRVMDESEAIRDRIQVALYDMLRERRSVWFG